MRIARHDLMSAKSIEDSYDCSCMPVENNQKHTEVKIASFGVISSDEAIERALRVLASLKQEYSFHYYLNSSSDDLNELHGLASRYGMTERVTINAHVSGQELARTISATDIALQLHENVSKEPSIVLHQIMAAGVASVVPDAGRFAELPGDVAVKVDLDEHTDALLQAYLRRLLEDAQLRVRIGANARRYIHATESANQTVAVNAQRASSDPSSSNGRFGKIEGMDYKRGAIEYPLRLEASDRHHLLTKPFYNLAHKHSEKYAGDGMDEDTRRHFCDFANLAHTLALPAGARLLDVGCGSGWLCEYFARLGYDVTGIDISPDLIEMARERVGRVPYGADQETALRYRFLVHDIESAPLIETFDTVICYDSLHHFEDERAVIRHLAMMIDDGGLLFVLEGERPPAGSQTEEELRDVMRRYETLESPFSREYLCALLREHGFMVIGDYVSVNGLFEREMMSDGRLSVEPSAVNYLLCKKVKAGGATAASVPDSRQPGALRARITLEGERPERVVPCAMLQLSFELENTGDTLWLTSRAALKGTVRFGIKLFDETGTVVDEFHGQPPLTRALAPGEHAKLSLDYRAPHAPGAYTLKIDLINQDICWFEERGSEPLMLSFQVQP